MGTAFATRQSYQTDALSPGQMEFLKNLLTQIQEIQPGKCTELREQLNAEYLNHTLTGARASARIDEFKAIRDELCARQREMEDRLRQMEQGDAPSSSRAAEPRPQVPAGRYAVDTEEGKLAFYRVAVDENGRYSVFVFASDQQHLIKGWKSQLTILRKIEKDGIESAGNRFADERGECRDCGRGLTDQESRAARRGPVCRNK
jgi:hypothetical protein